MPELPEVEVIRQGLLPRVVGRRIRSAKITAPRLTRRRGGSHYVEAALAGREVSALRRRGKWLLFELDGSETLVVRLGMTGQLLWAENEAALWADRHVHARVDFSGGGVLAYRDIRKFGEIFLMPTADLETRLSLGVEPLGTAFTFDALQAICRSSARIKPLLLDQRRIAGIGNIYADEALFRAGIRPTRPAVSLRAEEVRALRRAIRTVLRAGIRHRGSSISDYRDAEGRPGHFVLLHRVYARAGQPCLVCGRPVTRILLGQRGTHFCRHCQL
jgi:formamidopyrimidine-DNA glycosylase